MFKKKKTVFFLILILFCIVCKGTFAAEDKEAGVGFNVLPIFNSNQLDSAMPLFYLKTEPGQDQEVSVKITGTGKGTKKIKMESRDAFTSVVPSIAYATPDKIKNKDETLIDPVTELIEFENDIVEIKDTEEKTVKIKVKAPQKLYEGVKLGAISFFEVEEETEKGKPALGANAGYELGVILASNGEQFNVGDTILLGDVKADLVLGRKAVTANLQNPTPFTIENLDIKVDILDKKNKIIKQKEVKGGSIAPNSNFDFEVDWGLAELPAGEFIYKMVIKNDFYEWPFEQPFTISGAIAKKINDESGYKIKTPKWIKIVSVGQGIGLLIISTSLIIRRKKMVKEFEKTKTKRNRNKNRNKKRRK